MGHSILTIFRWYERIRCKVFSVLISGAFAHFGSSTMIVSPVRLVGENRIWIGDRVYIGAGSWLQTLSDLDRTFGDAIRLSIGSGTSIAGTCVISAAHEVVLEEDVLLARNVYISDHIHRYSQRNTPIIKQGIDKVWPVRIRRGAWLGQNVIICPGVTVGEGAVVGGNSVVTEDVPDFCVAVEAPARVIKKVGVDQEV
jgi:acetyltransferase-like isoleucine patch superfamily enzyme